jgi:hypothetical protein
MKPVFADRALEHLAAWLVAATLATMAALWPIYAGAQGTWQVPISIHEQQVLKRLATVGVPVSGSGARGRPAVWTNTAGMLTDTTLFTDVTQWGAVCDGSEINAAVSAAFTAGVRRLFLPSGCSWSGATAIPANAIVQGSGPLTLITGPVTVGNNSSFLGVTYQGMFKENFTNMTGTPRVADAVNSGFLSLYKGHLSGAVDQDTGIAITHMGLGTGDNFYAQTDPSGSATNFRNALYRGDLYASAEDPSVVVFDAYLWPTAALNAHGWRVTDFRTAFGQSPMLYQTTTLTGGEILKIYHQTSALGGSAVGLSIDLGNLGGSFTGDFALFRKAGANRFEFTHDGNLIITGYGLSLTATGGGTNFVVIHAPAATAGYGLVLPSALPGAVSWVQSSPGGDLSFVAVGLTTTVVIPCNPVTQFRTVTLIGGLVTSLGTCA